MQKSFKNFLIPLKYISKWHFLLLCLLLLFSSLDGIVNAQLFGTIAKINATNYQEIVVKALFFGIGGYGFVFTAIMLSERLKNKFIQDSFVALKSAYIEQNFYQKEARVNTDTVMNTVLNDTKILEKNYFQALFTFIYQVSMAICSSLYLFSLNLPLAFVFIGCSLFAMLPTWLLGSRVTASASIWSASNEIFVQKFRETLAGRTTLLAYGPKPFITSMQNQLALQEVNYKKMNNQAIFAAWVGWLGSIISFMGPILVGILMIQRGSGLTGPVLVSMLLASDRIIGPLRQAMQQFTLMQTTTEVRTKLLFNTGDSFNHQSAITSSNFQQLSVKNASVQYAADKIIHYPDIVIQKQAKIFITGPSGSGKTTFLHLIQGYLQPNSGTIEVLTSAGSEQPVLDMFATISQESFLINDTVRQNLTLGHSFSDERCEEVLASVGLLEELGTMGLEFITGENGTNLSGGQRQRIAIARALLFEKPIILADEITANLDQVAAEKVRAALYRTGLTIIEVAHHFSEDVLVKNNFSIYNLSPQNESENHASIIQNNS